MIRPHTPPAQVSPERAARAERLAPYFELQLRLARRLAEITGRPLGEAALWHTNFHRRFGLGRASAGVAPAWATFAEALERTGDLAAQVALTQATFLTSPEETPPGPGRTGFGCFACDDAPGPGGAVQIHFRNGDTDEAGGPLARGKLDRRRAEMRALIAHIRRTCPTATHIRGRSWLYNLAAYRRVFPSDYGASARGVGSEPVNLDGNSLWGQAIDSAERVRPDVRETLLRRLPRIDPAAPWRIFPLRVLSARAPLQSFEDFYAA